MKPVDKSPLSKNESDVDDNFLNCKRKNFIITQLPKKQDVDAGYLSDSPRKRIKLYDPALEIFLCKGIETILSKIINIINNDPYYIDRIIMSEEAIFNMIYKYEKSYDHPIDLMIKAGGNKYLLQDSYDKIISNKNYIVDIILSKEPVDGLKRIARLLKNFDSKLISHFISKDQNGNIIYHDDIFKNVFYNIFSNENTSKIIDFFSSRTSLWQQPEAKQIARMTLENVETHMAILSEINDCEDDLRKEINASLKTFIEIIYPEGDDRRAKMIEAYAEISSESGSDQEEDKGK